MILMFWIACAALGGLAITAGTAAFAKQALIEDAQAATRGYF